MSPRNEDFLFAQEAQRQGFVTDEHVELGFKLQRRMQQELELDERLSVILVKRGWMAEEQARTVYGRLEPGGRRNEIEGYEIVEKIGSGAMGTVYKAMHRGLGRPVAIKILRSDLAKENIHVERLKEEAKLLASLDHPNIVRALDAGESGGFPFVVMEYVEGESLKDRIRRKGAIREVDALKITRAMADALERARRMGVVHRDVKPGNIIISRQGEPKLMDLGLAKGPVDLGLTQHGVTVGTPQFISPEQAQDPRRADTRSDIYSLGATLYAMLAGRPPFSGKTLAEVITKVLYQEPTPVRVLNKSVSPETAYLIERMMLKDPALRYRTPAAVVRDLDAILEGGSIMPAGFRGNWEAHLIRRKYRLWTRLAAAGGLVLILLGIAVYHGIDARRKAEQARLGSAAVAEVLDTTRPQPLTDDLSRVQDKLMAARTTLDRWRDTEPDQLDLLEARWAELDAERRDFQTYERELLPEVDRLTATKTRAYAQALAKLEAFAAGIQRVDSAVRRRVEKRRARVLSDSNAAFALTIGRRRARVAASLAEEVDVWRAYARELDADFVVHTVVTRAREEAGHVTRAIDAIERRVETLETELGVSALRSRLDAFEFEGIRREMENRRQLLREFVAKEWAPLEALGFGSIARIWNHVETRLAVLDRAVDAQVDARWKEVQRKVRAFEEEGAYDAAIGLLDGFRDAVDRANYPSLRRQASDARWELDDRRTRERDRAANELGQLLTAARARVREARPEALRRLLDETLEGKEDSWPFRDDVRELRGLSEALEALLVAAGDYVARQRRLAAVRLRGGRVERRWIPRGVDRKRWTVKVSLSQRGDPEDRPLAEVAPDQLAEWAQASGEALGPMARAVVILMGLDGTDPPDLRPKIRALDTLMQAFDEVGIEGALATWARRQLGRTETLQRRREEDVRAQVKAADYAFSRSRYELAYQHFRKLLLEDSPLRYTEAFAAGEAEFRAGLQAVEAELANKRLSLDFPAARITSRGDVTDILYDWESDLQMEIFRAGVARVCGVIEPYATSRVATPGGTSHRLHLLRGAEGLVKDSPLVLPSIFDPAERITLSFDLQTSQSPFFLAIDIDGLQVGVLSADPTSLAYQERWRFPPDAPRLQDEKNPPKVAWYGKGRGVAFHAGKGFGDPTNTDTWDWPRAGFARHRERWRDGKRRKERLFAFEAGSDYQVKIVRDPGRIALYVDDRLVAERREAAWLRIGRGSDKDRSLRGGTGLLQIWTWTPMYLDNLRLSGVVLEKYR